MYGLLTYICLYIRQYTVLCEKGSVHLPHESAPDDTIQGAIGVIKA